MTWLNNATNNQFQINSKLDIDITKLYWDNPPYGINYGFTGVTNNNKIPHTTSYLIPLRFGTKKVICGQDFVSLSNPTNDANPHFIIDTSSFDLSTYIYHIKVNANIKGFNTNKTDFDITSSYIREISTTPGIKKYSGLKHVFLNNPASGTLQNFITTNLGNISANINISDVIAPYTGRLQSLTYFPYLNVRNITLSSGLSEISDASSLNTINSLFSLNTNNKYNVDNNSISNISSNNYSVNKIEPIDHLFFDFYLIKEYTQFKGSGLSSTNPILRRSIITTDSTRSSIDYSYMCFFICSSFYTSVLNAITDGSFMYQSSSKDLNKNDIISNVEIEITRYPR